LEICISQHSTAAQLGCSGVFNNNVIPFFTQSVPVKKCSKLVNIWCLHGHKYGGMFFVGLRYTHTHRHL